MSALKQLCVSCVICLGLSTATTSSYAQASSLRYFQRGDANADGVVNIADAVVVLHALFATSDRVSCWDALDADDSGTVAVTDAVRILLFAFDGRQDGIPAPGPDVCGRDPTDDSLSCHRFYPCGSVREDLSGFGSFEFSVDGVLRIGDILQATIEIEDDHALVALWSVEPLQEGEGECADVPLDPRDGIDCAEIVEWPPRDLSEVELSAVRTVFSDILIDLQPPAGCEMIDVGRVVTTRNFCWNDDIRITDLFCTRPPNLRWDKSDQIADLLETFKAQ